MLIFVLLKVSRCEPDGYHSKDVIRVIKNPANPHEQGLAGFLYSGKCLFFSAAVVFHELCTFERIDVAGSFGIHLAFKLRQAFVAFIVHPFS